MQHACRTWAMTMTFTYVPVGKADQASKLIMGPAIIGQHTQIATQLLQNHIYSHQLKRQPSPTLLQFIPVPQLGVFCSTLVMITRDAVGLLLLAHLLAAKLSMKTPSTSRGLAGPKPPSKVQRWASDKCLHLKDLSKHLPSMCSYALNEVESIHPSN